ncbi:MAG: hypothetical protein OXG17_03100 [Chloroflexi bacterium]|nr:hypothetical protein [Chloroflexota bacterium]
MRLRNLALLLAKAGLITSVSPVAALAPSVSPGATPDADLSVTDPGLILVIVVIPVVLVALIWMGYIFWLIFDEGENVGSGAPPPPGNRHRPPANRSQEPPDQPGNVG